MPAPTRDSLQHRAHAFSPSRPGCPRLGVSPAPARSTGAHPAPVRSEAPENTVLPHSSSITAQSNLQLLCSPLCPKAPGTALPPGSGSALPPPRPQPARSCASSALALFFCSPFFFFPSPQERSPRLAGHTRLPHAASLPSFSRFPLEGAGPGRGDGLCGAGGPSGPGTEGAGAGSGRTARVEGSPGWTGTRCPAPPPRPTPARPHGPAPPALAPPRPAGGGTGCRSRPVPPRPVPPAPDFTSRPGPRRSGPCEPRGRAAGPPPAAGWSAGRSSWCSTCSAWLSVRARHRCYRGAHRASPCPAPVPPSGALPWAESESASADGTGGPGSPHASAWASPLRFCGAGPGATGRHLPGPCPGAWGLLRGAHRPHRQRGRGWRGRADTGSRPGAAGPRRGSWLPGLSRCGAVALSGSFEGVHGWELGSPGEGLGGPVPVPCREAAGGAPLRCSGGPFPSAAALAACPPGPALHRQPSAAGGSAAAGSRVPGCPFPVRPPLLHPRCGQTPIPKTDAEKHLIKTD